MLSLYMATSHTNTHTVRGRPTLKKEIRRFRNELIRELKVNERKLLRQSKTLPEFEINGRPVVRDGQNLTLTTKSQIMVAP